MISSNQNISSVIRSRRNKVKFYATSAFGFVFFCLLGIAVGSIFVKEFSVGNTHPKIYYALIFGLGCFFMAFYGVIKYIQNSPRIDVGSHSITFRDMGTYDYNDIVELQLTGKMPFRYIVLFPMEGAMFKF